MRNCALTEKRSSPAKACLLDHCPGSDTAGQVPGRLRGHLTGLGCAWAALLLALTLLLSSGQVLIPELLEVCLRVGGKRRWSCQQRQSCMAPCRALVLVDQTCPSPAPEAGLWSLGKSFGNWKPSQLATSLQLRSTTASELSAFFIQVLMSELSCFRRWAAAHAKNQRAGATYAPGERSPQTAGEQVAQKTAGVTGRNGDRDKSSSIIGKLPKEKEDLPKGFVLGWSPALSPGVEMADSGKLAILDSRGRNSRGAFVLGQSQEQGMLLLATPSHAAPARRGIASKRRTTHYRLIRQQQAASTSKLQTDWRKAT